DDEYAFSQLRKFRPALKGEGKKQVYTQLSYALIDKSVGERAYQAIADSAKYFDQIVDEIKTEFEVKPEPISKSTVTLLGGGPTAAVNAVLSVLKEDKNRDRVREIIREVVASENEKKRESKKANFVYAQLKKANTALQDAAGALN